jgi:hypothetical protein
VTAGIAGLSPDFDSHHATLRAHYAADARWCSVSVESSLATLTSGSHFTQVTFGRDGVVQSALLDRQSATAKFEPSQRADQRSERPAEKRAAVQRWQSITTISLVVLGVLSSSAMLLILRWLAHRAKRLPPAAIAETKPVPTPNLESNS